jgi:type VI secretion system protein VasD
MNKLMLCAMLVMAAVLTGCAAKSVNMRLVGVAPLNEAQAGESRPVRVRIFQLRDDETFMRANMEQLWVDPSQALANSMIGVPIEVNIFPEDADQNPAGRPVEVPISQETRFIGVFAMYDNTAEDSQRRRVLSVEQARNARLRLTRYTVEVVE